MGFVAAILAAAGALAFWMYRARDVADASHGMLDIAQDARSAIRRFGYRRKKNVNPLDDVDDPRLAAAGILAATARLDGDYTREQLDRISRECLETFEVSQAEAEDMTAFGRWLAQHGEPEEVVRRLGRNLRATLGDDQRTALHAMISRVAAVEGGAPSERQEEVRDMLERLWR